MLAGFLQHTSLETACKQEQGVMGACPAVASSGRGETFQADRQLLSANVVSSFSPCHPLSLSRVCVCVCVCVYVCVCVGIV